MKQKDIKQLVAEVVIDFKNKNVTSLNRKNIGRYVAGGAVGLVLKTLYDKFKKEKDPKKKAVLKAKINKAKSKIKAKKAVKESYNFNEEDLVEVFGEGLGSAIAKGISKAKFLKGPSKKAVKKMSIIDRKYEQGVTKNIRNAYRKRVAKKTAKIGGGVVAGGAVGTGIKKLADKASTKQKSQVAVSAAAVGVAGVLAYKLYKKLKEKFSKEKDPKEKAKLKKLMNAQKAKMKKK
jgi:hypothetical protein